MVFAAEDSPVYMLGGFDLMAAMLDNHQKIEMGIPDRRRDRMGQAGRSHVLCGGALLPPRLPQ